MNWRLIEFALAVFAAFGSTAASVAAIVGEAAAVSVFVLAIVVVCYATKRIYQYPVVDVVAGEVY